MNSFAGHFDREPPRVRLVSSAVIVILIAAAGTFLVASLSAGEFTKTSLAGAIVFGQDERARWIRSSIVIVPIGMVIFGIYASVAFNRAINGIGLTEKGSALPYPVSPAYLAFGVATLIAVTAIIAWGRTDGYVFSDGSIGFRKGPLDQWHSYDWRQVKAIEQNCRFIRRRNSGSTRVSVAVQMKDGQNFETKLEDGTVPISKVNPGYGIIRQIAARDHINYVVRNRSNECADAAKDGAST